MDKVADEMLSHLWDQSLLWLPFLITFLLTGVPLIIGRRLRLLHQKYHDDGDDSAAGIVIASLLGLLTFLLAFTFGLAATRYEDRRQAVLAEANVIGTAYLRADLISEQQRSDVKCLLRRYSEIRSKVAAPVMAPQALQEIIVQSVQMHDTLWKIAVDAAETDPSPITALFIPATNDLIDAHSTRVILGTESTISLEIWMCLYAVAAISLGAAGFQWKGSSKESAYSFVALVVVFAGVLTLVADLDDPTHGFIRTDQLPMLELYKNLKADVLPSCHSA